MKSHKNLNQANQMRQLLEAIEERKDELFALLCGLVRIDSQNFRTYGREQDCTEHIAGLLGELDLAADVYSPDVVDGMIDHPDYLAAGPCITGRMSPPA